MVEGTWLIGFYGWDWRRTFLHSAQSLSRLPTFFARLRTKSSWAAPQLSQCPRQPHHFFEQGSVGTYLHICCNVILSVSDNSLSGFGHTLIEIASGTPAHPT